MNTTRVNPTGGNSSKKKVATYAATAAGAAGLGVAGAAVASELNDEPIAEVIEEVPSETSGQNQPNQNQPNPNQSSQPTETSTNSTSNGSSSTSTSGTADTTANEQQPITSDDDPVEEVVEEVEEAEEESPQQDVSEDVSEDTTEPVNPDDVAEAIIAEEQIDPNDIDMADVFNFDEIGSVYTVDGESYTAAAFHDAAGNQFVMVDVDGDDVFDVITDMEGNLLTDPQGNVLAAGDITVDDAEIGIADNHTYLAADDTATTDDFGADSLMNDIIS